MSPPRPARVSATAPAATRSPASALAPALALALAPALALALAPACMILPRGERPPAGRLLSLPVHTLGGEFESLEITPGRVGVVVVFATWCDLCAETLEAVRTLAEATGDGLEAVAVSVDADPRLLGRHLAEHPPGMRVLWDREGQAARRRLALEQVPTVLVVDGEGRIRRVFTGWDRSLERAVERAVEQHLVPSPGQERGGGARAADRPGG